MVFVAAICGTPGSGKSTLISGLKKKLGDNIEIINMSELVRKEKLYKEYDDEMDACVMDHKMVKRRITELIKSGSAQSIFLIETHTPSMLPKSLVDVCFVLTCETHVIYDRLTSRGYSARKRDENVQAEIMQVVQEEATNRFGRRRVQLLNNNAKADLKESVKIIKKIIQRKNL